MKSLVSILLMLALPVAGALGEVTASARGGLSSH